VACLYGVLYGCMAKRPTTQIMRENIIDVKGECLSDQGHENIFLWLFGL
jgi:hypothetical protein